MALTDVAILLGQARSQAGQTGGWRRDAPAGHPSRGQALAAEIPNRWARKASTLPAPDRKMALSCTLRFCRCRSAGPRRAGTLRSRTAAERVAQGMFGGTGRATIDEPVQYQPNALHLRFLSPPKIQGIQPRSCHEP